MVLGMPLATFTLVHVVISLIGIGSGFIVLFGLVSSRAFDRVTIVFLTSTALTSATGFLFPFEKLLPSHVVGIISLLVLAVAIAARYAFHLSRAWRWVYAVAATLAVYLNVFVLIVQSFQKIPALKAMAPTETEPAFKIAQLVVLAIFIALGMMAVKRFRPSASAVAG
jgi:hypothetical protein